MNNQTDRKPVFAHTSKGTVQGFLCTYNGGKDEYYSFRDVRYAQIPVGDLRFANPKEISSYQNTSRNMNHDDSDDSEKVTNKNTEDTKKKDMEDCLFVHIYTPEVRPDGSDLNYTRPVIVFVPSMSFHLSGAFYGGEFLMAEDVVLVVLFHRQDIFGFTGLFQEPNEELNRELNIFGDAGLQDIIKGFEFVKKEIRHFGGCPDNITAYGQGLSCAYIRWLTLDPYSGEYFHKMILSSSMEHSLKRTLQRCQYDLREVAKIICPDEEFDDDKACVEYLRNVAVERLTYCSDPIWRQQNRRVVRKNNLLAVEGDDYRVKMPVLIGFNANEALLEMYFEVAVPPRSRSLGQLLWLTQTQSTEKEADKKAAKAVEFYRKNLVKLGRHHERCLEMIETDISYVIGTLHLARSLVEEMDPKNVYLFKFSAEFDTSYGGASHNDEMTLILKSVGESWQENSLEDKISKIMTGVWARFARTGNPDQANGSETTWAPVGEELTHYFEIDNNGAAYREFSDFEKARFQFWEQTYGIRFISGPKASPPENTDEAADESERKGDNEDENVAAEVNESDISRMPTCSHAIPPKEESRVTILTEKGPIVGHACLLGDNRYYYSFQHVPYAQVPVGKLRFAAPKAISSFEDLKQLKLDENGRYGLEDHLFLHIYLPKGRAETPPESYKRPVIVFVPDRLSPKAQQYRSEDLYGPQFLMQEDVVVVVLSYRRGILGFTAFKESNAELDVPINAGVHDIVMAFTFVKAQIQFFGGCPDNVTAYGQGTGATHVQKIAAQIPKNDLFHKMILSSSMEHATGIASPRRYYDVRLILDRISGKDDADDRSCIELLRGLPVDELLNYESELINEEHNSRIFCSEHLYNLSTAASYGTSMPVLIGYNSLEGLIDRLIWDEYHEGLQDLLLWKSICRAPPPRNSISESVHTTVKKTIEIYKGFSTKERKEHTKQEIVEIILSDLNYTVGTVALATHFAKAMAPENVYLYRFAVDLDCNFTARLYNSSPLGDAAHADELGYIFKTPITTSVIKNSLSDLTIKRMTKLWVQFAKTGNPNPEKGDKMINAYWKPIQKDLNHCLHINNSKVSYAKIPQAEMKRFQFWESYANLNFFSMRKNNERDDKNKKRRE